MASVVGICMVSWLDATAIAGGGPPSPSNKGPSVSAGADPDTFDAGCHRHDRPTSRHSAGRPRPSGQAANAGRQVDDDCPGWTGAAMWAAAGGNRAIYSRLPFRDCPICPRLVIVPGGNGQYGTPLDERGRTADEPVATTLAKSPFAIGRTELLRKEFAAFVEETGHRTSTRCDVGVKRSRGTYDWQHPNFEQDNRHPVVCVNWHDANAYLAWLGRKTGLSYRLPSQIEWEYAARGRTTTPFWQGATLRSDQANVGAFRDGTLPGGLFKPNPFGLSDTSGNVWELTADCDVQSSSRATSCRFRIVKGGGWSSPPHSARPGARRAVPNQLRHNTVGFRIARDLDARDNVRLLSPQQAQELQQPAHRAAEIAAEQRAAAEPAARKRRLDRAKR